MAIDVFTDTPIRLSDVPALPIVPRRRGKKLHLATVHRWASPHGVRGVRLETIVCGGALCTSAAAVALFFERLTAARNGEPVPVRTRRQRERAIKQAEQVLTEAGI